MRKSKRGFTLGELLVVVAIIGVLVGISIPIFTSQLEKSRQATDLANMRSAKAAALDEWMSEGMPADYSRKYDAAKGIMTDATPEGYGQSTKPANTFFNGNVSGTPNVDGNPGYLTISINASGAVSYVWGTGFNLGKWNTLSGTLISDDIWWKNDKASNYANQNAYEALLASDNTARQQADQEIVNNMAGYFSSLSDEELQAMLGNQYNKMLKNKDGAVLFNYQVDNNSYSVKLNPDGSTNSADYFKNMGYDPRIYVTQSSGWAEQEDFVISGGNNYVNTYLFTSDEAIGKQNVNNQVYMKLTKDSEGNTQATVWVKNGQNGVIYKSN